LFFALAIFYSPHCTRSRAARRNEMVQIIIQASRP
jgi:hypothetical protein